MMSNNYDSRPGAQTPGANLITIQRPPLEGEPELPEHIRRRQHREMKSEVDLEWDPILPFEELEGELVRKTTMTLGGTAYVFDLRTEKERNEALSLPKLVLLKKGGRILESCMSQVEVGDRVYIRYRGELPAKPGQNPARDWRVIKLQ